MVRQTKNLDLAIFGTCIGFCFDLTLEFNIIDIRTSRRKINQEFKVGLNYITKQGNSIIEVIIEVGNYCTIIMIITEIILYIQWNCHLSCRLTDNS